jgi:hypothetical protein
MSERLPFPTEEELHEARMEELKLSMHVAGVGRIQSYDPVHQVADIVPMVRHPVPQPDGSYLFEDLPVLPSVPVLFPRMGKWFLAFSVEPGDAVQIVYDSASPGTWRRQADNGATGLDRLREIKHPTTLQRHSLSHAVAIAGIDTYLKALTHAPPVAVNSDDAQACLTLGSDLADGTRLSIYGNGVMKVTRGVDVVLQIDADGDVNIGGPAGALLAKAAETDAIVSSLKSLIASWTPVPNDGGASLKAVIAGWSPASVATTKAKGA